MSTPSEPTVDYTPVDEKPLTLSRVEQFYYLKKMQIIFGSVTLGLICVLIITVSITLYRLNWKCATTTTTNYNVWAQITPSGSTPAGRLSAAAVNVGNKMYVFGGCYGQTLQSIPYQYFNDMWVYNDDDDTWTEITQLGAVPQPRLYHSMVVQGDTQILLFGGFTTFQGQPGHDSYDDFYRFDTTTNTWYDLTNTSVVVWPSKRGAQGAIYVDGYMYMYGGFPYILSTGHLQEMWRFEWSTQTWAQLTVSGPEGRIGFPWVVVGDYAYMMSGGCSTTVDTSGQCNSIWQYQWSINQWTQKSTTSSTKPAARRASNADVAVGGIVYETFGVNISTTVTIYDDLWAYDPSSDTWMQMYPNFYRGSRPPPTFGHVVVRIQSRVIVFGGRINSVLHPGSNQLWEYTPLIPI